MLKSGIVMSKKKWGILKFCKAVGNNDCENDDNIVALQYCPHIWQLNPTWFRLCSQYTGWFFVPTPKAIRYSMNSNDTELEQVLHTHWTSSSCWSGWPRGLSWTKSQSLLYLLPSQRVAALIPTYSLRLLFGYLFTLHLCVAQNLYDMKRSIFEIGATQLLSVTEIAPTVMFYVWKETLSGARAILYSVNVFFRSNRLAITACFSCDGLLDLRCKTLKDLAHLKIGTFLMNKFL